MEEQDANRCDRPRTVWGCSALRSAVVRRDVRGIGICTNLVMKALRRAKGRDVKMIYLLTETAEEYFLRFNFRKINRRHVDQRIQQSIEFKRACPKSAVTIKLRLDSTDVR